MKKKRLLSGIIAFLMLLQIIPINFASFNYENSVFAEGNMVNIASSGSGYYWNLNQTDTSNSHRLSSSTVNDNNTSTLQDTDPAGSQNNINDYNGTGVVFSSAQNNVSKIDFVNGNIVNGNGYFEANCKLQFSTDGTTWTNATGWTLSPAYTYNGNAANNTYTYTGTAMNNIRAVRVVGQVRAYGKDDSWSFRIREFRV